MDQPNTLAPPATASFAGAGGPSHPVRSALWSILELPVRVLLIGGVGLGLLWLADQLLGNRAASVLAALRVEPGKPGLVAVLIFLVGIGFAAFLWWLASRFFSLLRDGTMSQDAMAGLKDLPMALPEGTVRAVLALVVAVVGLPLLLFSKSLDLTDGVAGYVNGIITGVFGFYFGTRATGVPAQAVNKITDAEARARTNADVATAAKQQAATAIAATHQAEQKVATAVQETRAATFATTLDRVNRHLGLARTVLRVFGPALPSGLLPPGLDELVATAERAVGAVKGVSGDTATEAQLRGLTDVAASLTGKDSPLGALLERATPLMGALPVAGLGPGAGLALLLGLGGKLGSSQFQRWRARVLAAPLAQGLIEFGTVTPTLVHEALQRSPIMLGWLAGKDDGTFDATLADALLRDDGADKLWLAFGDAGAKLVPARDRLADALEELRQSLLSLYAANDVPAATIALVGEQLATAANPALAPPSGMALTPQDANRLIDAASGVSARPDAPIAQRAALDALVLLVDTARRNNIDLVTTMRELRN